MKSVGDEETQHLRLATKLDQSGLLWCHVPNEGKRTKQYAYKLKRMGLKPGVPDILIFTEPRTAIELKRSDGKGRTSKEQQQWLKDLTAAGWLCYVCNGETEALQVIKEVYGWQPVKRKRLKIRKRS